MQRNEPGYARRRSNRSTPTRLATIQRIVRAQRFEGAPSHFTLLALTTGGRDVGNLRFESDAIAEHIAIHVAGDEQARGRAIRVLLTDVTEARDERLIKSVTAKIGKLPHVAVEFDEHRGGGRANYRQMCFKVRASVRTVRQSKCWAGERGEHLYALPPGSTGTSNTTD
jgi:hypothetical protein